MISNIFVDEILTNIVSRLKGPDRQNLSHTCKRLRSLVSQEQIRLIRNETKRLIDIFANNHSPFSQRFKEDALKLLNNQPFTVEDQFVVLCCFIKMIRYYVDVQLSLWFLTDLSPKYYHNLVVKVFFAISFADDKRHDKHDELDFLNSLLSNLLPDYDSTDITSFNDVKKMFKRLHPSIRDKVIHQLKISKQSRVHPYFILIESLSVRIDFYPPSLNHIKIPTLCYFHNELLKYGYKEINDHVLFYQKYKFNDNDFQLVYPLTSFNKIVKEFKQQNIRCNTIDVLLLITKWHRSMASVFYTLHEFCERSKYDLSNKINKTKANLNWPLTMMKNKSQGLFSWSYDRDGALSSILTKLLYFVPKNDIYSLNDYFIGHTLETKTALQLSALHYQKREKLIDFLNTPLFKYFIINFQMTPKSFIDIYLDFIPSEQKLLKILVNSHIVSFISQSFQKSTKKTLKFLCNITIDRLDQMHNTLIDFYFNKLTRLETIDFFRTIIEAPATTQLNCTKLLTVE